MIDFEILIVAAFWVFVTVALIIRGKQVSKGRPQKGFHPTTINKASSPARQPNVSMPKKTISSDGHRIPKSKDITCDGQYGHDHGDMPRYIVHDDPPEGYCNLNGKIVALKDCWKY